MGVNCRGAARVRLRVANVAHSTLCHVDDREGVTGGALTECQSHFGQTTLLSVRSLAPGASNTSIIHTERGKERRNRLGASETY